MSLLTGLAVTSALMLLGADIEISHEETTLLTPSANLSFRRFRGDWEPPSGVLLVYWPAWQKTLGQIAEQILLQSKLYLLVDPSNEEEARVWLEQVDPSGEAEVLVHPVDTPWVRDYGPLQVQVGHSIKWLDAIYAGDRPLDDAIVPQIAAALAVPFESLPLKLDGGGLVSNGHGLCVITLETFELSNLSLFDQDAHNLLLRKLGCSVIAVVPPLLDEPTGHADMFVQFLSPDVVAVASVDPSWFDDRARLEETVRGLKRAAKHIGQKLRVVRVPMPILEPSNYRSYINGLRLPSAFLVPSYEDVPREIEQRAHRALAGALKGRELLPIPAKAMADANGVIHCLTVGLTIGQIRPGSNGSLLTTMQRK